TKATEYKLPAIALEPIPTDEAPNAWQLPPMHKDPELLA
ncbi:unnamed protein product, partial [marine sediment metagenome]